MRLQMRLAVSGVCLGGNYQRGLSWEKATPLRNLWPS